jgi:ribosomal protein S12 methylthiotransferase
MLGLMRRETSSQYIRDLVRDIRAGIPGITLRTTFIVGAPGETEDDQKELLQFMRDTHFERLGVFEYSQEEGTKAAKMDDQIPAKLKKRRWHEAMGLQREIAAAVSASMVGRRLRVLVESPGVARAEGDAPDIDGRVYVPKTLPAGEFTEVEITGAAGYDLLAGVAAPEGGAFRELVVAQ